jgi:hypothetical protein
MGYSMAACLAGSVSSIRIAYPWKLLIISLLSLISTIAADAVHLGRLNNLNHTTSILLGAIQPISIVEVLMQAGVI